MRAVAAAAICLTLSGCGQPADETALPNGVDTQAATFVGAQVCASCHSRQFTDWRDSHHAKAMQPATDETVLGDFADAEFPHFGVRNAFFRRNGQFRVRTDNADGELQDFEVAYTFGVSPLQQYLVEFPDGRVQALPTAWDARPRGAGGQRWFHVYGDEYIASTDPLHWTGREQNWNYMCAECHSTGLEKNYDASTDSFGTTWTEINVACEACHGPGSRHAGRPAVGLPVDLNDAGESLWRINAATGIAERSDPPAGKLAQPEACGRCHSRRANIAPAYVFGRPLTDTHLPSLLDEHLYYPDGQIKDEVYVYGSFLQSRMYAAGVTCSDCHDPHTAALKTAGSVSRVCASCHLPSRFDSSAHHRHPQAAVECVDCHMPSRTYMVVDPRRDHSFRIPRPDLTVGTGSPNACKHCHSDQDDRSLSEAAAAWYGRPASHFAEAIQAARRSEAGANALLIELIADGSQPGIARATALTLLAAPISGDARALIERELSSRDPLIRIAALRALDTVSPDYRARWAAALLTDPSRAVRLQAVSTLSPLRDTLRQAHRERFDAAEKEYIDSQLAIAERPESHINLGILYAEAGESANAEASYLQALSMEPRAVAARANLADLYRSLGRDGDAERLLREGQALDDKSAPLHHALGLVLVRNEKPDAALVELARAVELEAGNPRFVYVYGVALNSLGRSRQAMAVLEKARESFPGDYDIGWALATMYRDSDRTADARAEASRLLQQFPEDANSRRLLESL
ncbi:MAG: tetratricopeptide repeat protein [Woeseia sp.]